MKPRKYRKVGDSLEVRFSVRRRVKTPGEVKRYRELWESGKMEVDRKFREGVRPCCTIRDKLDEFLSDCLTGFNRYSCGEATAKTHRRRLLVFDAAFHSRPLDAVTAAEVERWMKRRRRRVSAETVNLDLVSLRAFANWAKQKGYAPRVLDIDTVGRMHSGGKVAGTKRRPPEVMEVHALLDAIEAVKAVREDIGLFFEGMFIFCFRPAAVAMLRRSDLRLPVAGRDGTLESKGLKGLYDRTLPVAFGSEGHRWAKECLALARRHGHEGDHPLLICIQGHSARNPGGWTTDTFDKAAGRILRKFGVYHTPYVIRHSVITWVQGHPGVDGKAVSQLAGHAKLETKNIYTHRVAADAVPAHRAIDELFKSRRRSRQGEGQGGGVSAV